MMLRERIRCSTATRGLSRRRDRAHNRAVPAAYRFLDRWTIPAPIERVYDAIGDPLRYERWWTNFGLEVLEAERPRRILSRLSKDFDGTGLWTLEETADGTQATLDWRPMVNHPLIKYLTPLLRPLFRSNHNWAMRRGERQLREYLAGGAQT
jgi:hypothetical protein